MKLLDLLVQELPERGGWPEAASYVVQDYDGTVKFSKSINFLHIKAGEWCSNEDGDDWIYSDRPFEGNFHHYITANDWKVSIVTREQYKTALAASKAVVGHDGWIQWAGGDCPVDSDAIVEVKFRKPIRNKFNNDRAGDFSWTHDGFDGDIIAYRVHDTEINSSAKNDRLEQDLNECIGQDLDPAWSGNGLPPVGAKVEFFINPKLGYRNDWIPDAGTKMEVVAHKTTTDGNDVAVCYWDEGGAGRSCCFVPESLKPLRTEAEKKRDAFINAVLDDMRVIPCDLSLRDEVAVIYDAIAAGKIPGVKLDK